MEATMGKFRKKPVVIEAFQWKGNGGPFPSWFNAAIDYHKVIRNGDAWTIKTLEGEHKASLNDWIIRGIMGELYPCKPDIFAETYEPAE